MKFNISCIHYISFLLDKNMDYMSNIFAYKNFYNIINYLNVFSLFI